MTTFKEGGFLSLNKKVKQTILQLKIELIDGFP
jgi:hypothetical protein